TNIVSSELSSNTGNTTIIAGSLINNNNNLVITDADANVNIMSDTETHYSFEQNKKIRPNYAAVAAGAALSVAIGNATSGAVTGLGGSGLTGMTSGMVTSGAFDSATKGMLNKHSSTEKSNRDDLQIASNINSGNNIFIHSQNDANIIASNVNSENNTIISANNSVNVVSATENNSSSQKSSKSRLFSSEKASLDVVNKTNKDSNINAGNNLLIQSGSDTNIIASNVSAGTMDDSGKLIKGGNATIIAGKYVDETGTEIYNKDARLNIASAVDTTNSIHKVEKMSVKINDLSKIAKGAVSIYGTAGAVMSAYKVEYQDQKNTNSTITNNASNVNVANDLITNSSANTNILASNVNVGNDALMVAGTMNVNGVDQINDSANINIISAKDISTSKRKNTQMILANDIEFGGDITAATFEHKTEKSYSETNAASSIIVGNNLDIESANDVNVIGSNIMTGGDATLTAERKVNILASQNNSNDSVSNVSGEMGLELTLDANEISAGVSTRVDYQDDESQRTRQSSSNIIANNITINSNDDINLAASNLVAANDVNLTSTDGNINIISENEMSKQDSLHLGMEVGVKIGITHNIGNTIDSLTALGDISLANASGVGQVMTAIDMVDGLLSGDNVDEMLEGNEQVINDTSELLNAGGTGGSAGIVLHIEAEADKTSSKSNQALGSLVSGGNNINIFSNNKDIKIEGSSILATNDVNLTAGNDIEIIASNSNSSHKNIGGSLSLDIALYGVGFSVGGEIHGSKNSDNTHNNSVINAQNNINIISGNDATIKGANIEADNDLAMNVGGDLDVQSLQNTSKDRSFAIGGGYGTMGGGESYSANVGYSKGDRKWVDDQTTLIGGNSVDIKVGNNTNLVGAVIANKKADGTDGGNLNLETDTLTYSNIKDKDKARNFSVGGSYSSGSNKGDDYSATVGYSMHDKQQDTNATIGNGAIVIGGVNTSENEILVAGLNRDVNKAQVITKDLSVDPIEVTVTPRAVENLKDKISSIGNIISSLKNPSGGWNGLTDNPIANGAKQIAIDKIEFATSALTGNFKDIGSDLSLISQDMNSKGHEGVGNFVGNLSREVNKKSYATDRAFNISEMGKISKEAFENNDEIIAKYKDSDNELGYLKDPKFKPYAHEESAEKWGNYVGDAEVSGVIRTAGEVGQFFYYTGDDIFNLVSSGKHGSYQPYKFSDQNGGLIDSRNDVQNVINGANGNFKYYDPQN
ncbi:MAG: hypothetical protein ACJAW3_001163, partial [Lentimonas sp.]